MATEEHKKKRYYKPKRGRKSPNRLTVWETKFSKKLKRHHGTFAKKKVSPQPWILDYWKE